MLLWAYISSISVVPDSKHGSNDWKYIALYVTIFIALTAVVCAIVCYLLKMRFECKNVLLCKCG